MWSEGRVEGGGGFVREFGFRDGLGRNEDIALGLEMDGRAAEKGRFLQALRHTAGGNELKE